MSDEYRPIPCMQHERLEFSVLRRLFLELEYVKDGVRHRERVLPLDVNTRSGAEWLIARREHGDVIELRLDAILEFKELTSK